MPHGYRSDSAAAPENHTYKELRRRYDVSIADVSIAKAKLEFAKSGDDDKLWAAINDRQDARAEAILTTLPELDPPTNMDEGWGLLKLIEMFLEAKNRIGMTSEEIETAIELVKNVSNGITDIRVAESRARREAENKPESPFSRLSPT